MHAEVAEWLRNAKATIEAATTESVQELAKEAAEIVRDRTDSGRRLTRQAVRHKMTGPRTAVVGLFFGRRYTKNKNSFTYRHFRQVWRDVVRPELLRRRVKTLNSKLSR
jgi:hypothetical protein